MSAITELRALSAKPDGRIKLLYDTIQAALRELDEEWEHIGSRQKELNRQVRADMKALGAVAPLTYSPKTRD